MRSPRSKASFTSCAAWFVLLATGAGTAGSALIACTADDDDEIIVPAPDAALLDATLGDAVAQMDSGPVTEDGAVGDDAGDLDAGTDADAATPTPGHGIYAFSSYCGAISATSSVACPTATACGTFDGGIAAQICPTPGTECVARGGDAGDAGDAGGLDRVFDCVRAGQSVWALNALCGEPFADCADGTVPVAPCVPDDAAVEGNLCVPSLTATATRCMTAEGRYVCQTGNASTWVFNGYCDAGATAACGTTLSECTLDAGLIGGAKCATPFGRCLAGDRIFVCAAH